MSIVRPWAFWRRVQYGIGFLAMLVIFVGGSYALLRDTSVSCFDAIMNGDESGLDCGGTCVRICAAEVLPPDIVWAESFEIADGQYNAVAYVENLNEIAATPELRYTFQFFNGSELVAERSGSTILPPRSVYPIFEGRIFVEKEITDTRLVIESPELWLPASIGREQFQTTNISLINADLKPRLTATIENTELTPAREVEVVATLFNANGRPITSSQTYVEEISPRSKSEIVFTWPNSITKTVRSCEIPTDVVIGIDLSGSMNNDDGNPPQPISNALLAASDFAQKLQDKDQAAIITFATEVSTDAIFTNDNTSIAQKVRDLKIKPSDETGFTNTKGAFEAASVELASSRHNQDARRVFVLLTDGLPTAPGESNETAPAEVIAVAKNLSEAGVEVYTIGLGENVNLEFITTIASAPANAYLAPTSADLSSIYAEITSSLCESGTSRIDVIAKTKTNFTPLE